MRGREGLPEQQPLHCWEIWKMSTWPGGIFDIKSNCQKVSHSNRKRRNVGKLWNWSSKKWKLEVFETRTDEWFASAPAQRGTQKKCRIPSEGEGRPCGCRWKEPKFRILFFQAADWLSGGRSKMAGVVFFLWSIRCTCVCHHLTGGDVTLHNASNSLPTDPTWRMQLADFSLEECRVFVCVTVLCSCQVN